MHIFTKHFFFIVFILCSSPSLASLEECKKPLRLSSTSQWHPYIYQDKNGLSKGIDVELLSFILQEMGCQLIVTHFPERRALHELSRGRFDIGLGASKTSTRLKSFFYSTPYRNELNKFAYRSNEQDLALARNLPDILKLNKIIAINYAGWYGKEIEKAKQEYQFFSYSPTATKRLEMLNLNRVDIVVDDELVLCSELIRAENKKIQIHPAVLFETSIHFIFNKESVSLKFVEQFDKVLESMKADGRLSSRYYHEHQAKCMTFSAIQNKR